MVGDFPRTVEEISTEWLSGALGGPVTGFEMTKLEGGLFAETLRLHSISYAGEAGDLPPSVVIKMAHPDADQRAMALGNNAYLKELRFFEDLAPDVPLRSPGLYASASDGSPQAEFFILVMEDLSVHSKVFNQVDDTPSADFALKQALELAEFHAQYWESSEVTLPWLGQPDGRYQFVLDSLARLAAGEWDSIRAAWKQMCRRDLFEGPDDQPLEELIARLCGPQCEAIIDAISDLLSSRPLTVLHGDLRVDNLFRTDPALGKGAEESALTYIDWQLIHAGPPGVEFTVAWMGSLEPEVRRLDLEMLRQYHARLVELEPAAAAYTYEMLVEDYALSCCVYWLAVLGAVPTIAGGLDESGDQRTRDLFHIAGIRSKAALRELNCAALIEQICAGLPEGGSVAG
jgi:hypothetical protein